MITLWVCRDRNSYFYWSPLFIQYFERSNAKGEGLYGYIIAQYMITTSQQHQTDLANMKMHRIFTPVWSKRLSRAAPGGNERTRRTCILCFAISECTIGVITIVVFRPVIQDVLLGPQLVLEFAPRHFKLRCVRSYMRNITSATCKPLCPQT
jgi:hypothetical protein